MVESFEKKQQYLKFFLKIFKAGLMHDEISGLLHFDDGLNVT